MSCIQPINIQHYTLCLPSTYSKNINNNGYNYLRYQGKMIYCSIIQMYQNKHYIYFNVHYNHISTERADIMRNLTCLQPRNMSSFIAYVHVCITYAHMQQEYDAKRIKSFQLSGRIIVVNKVYMY